jgi:biotin carboxylase
MRAKQKKILILGGSRYYLKSIETANKLGYFTIVTDKDPNSPAFSIADKYDVLDISDYQGVYKYSEQNKIDGIVALNDYGIYTASFVSEKLGLPGLNMNIARIATNKVLMRLYWESMKQPNPKFLIVYDLESARKACKEIGFPVIFKPAVSMGGCRGVVYVSHQSKVEESYIFATSFYADKTILVEEYLKGTEHSVEVLVYQNEPYILAIGDNIKSPFPYRINKKIIYPTQYTGEQRRKLEQTIKNAVKSLCINSGCIHLELCTLENGDTKLFEFGARPGGGGIPDPIVPFLTGVSEIEQYLKMCVGDVTSILIPKYEKGCVYIFFIPHQGKIRAIEGFEEVKKLSGVMDAELFIKENDEIKLARIGSERSGFIIVGGKDRQEALKLGEYAESLISIKYY